MQIGGNIHLTSCCEQDCQKQQNKKQLFHDTIPY